MELAAEHRAGAVGAAVKMHARRYQSREEWLAARRGRPCIGGSDVAAALGLHPQKSQWSLWSRLMGFGEPVEDTPRLRMGRRLEDAVLDEWAHNHPEYGLERRPYDIFAHPDRDWAVATLDGIAAVDGQPAAVVEAKTVCGWQEAEWREPGTIVCLSLDDLAPDRLPAPVHYFLQVVWQMYVTGLPHGWLVALFGSDFDGVREWSIPRPEWLVDLLACEVGEWWERHVVRGEPPPTDDSDDCAAFYRARLGDGKPERIEQPTPEMEAERRAYEEAAAAAKAAEARKNLARNRLLSMGAEPQNIRGQVRLRRRVSAGEEAA